MIIPLNNGWLFSERSLPDSIQPNFNDRAFQRINIPHTNKMLPMNGFDEKEYMFVSVYRRHFRLPAELKGRRIFIDLGGVMTAAKVFINGNALGEYRGGYTPFSFELTNNINWGGDNVLAVQVDSSERKDIPPFGNLVDYLTFGGIYRDVISRRSGQAFLENVFAKPCRCACKTIPKFDRIRVYFRLADSPTLIPERSSIRHGDPDRCLGY